MPATVDVLGDLQQKKTVCDSFNKFTVNSYTDVDDYLPYQISEVWLFKKNRLIIYSLQEERYIESLTSRYFLNFNVAEIVEECWEMSRHRSTSVVIRGLRQKLEKEN